MRFLLLFMHNISSWITQTLPLAPAICANAQQIWHRQSARKAAHAKQLHKPPVVHAQKSMLLQNVYIHCPFSSPYRLRVDNSNEHQLRLNFYRSVTIIGR
jgi:hypothetical protein